MSEQPQRRFHAYERLLHALHDTTEQVLPTLHERLAAGRERLIELGEWTREEADEISRYLQRDIEDAAHYLTETGGELKDWLRLDWRLVEDRLLESFAKVADQTSLQLSALAEQAREAARYHSGEICGPGILVCEQCGHTLTNAAVGEVPACPQCQGDIFTRMDDDSIVNDDAETDELPTHNA